MDRKEKRFWKRQMGCTPVEFAQEVGNILRFHVWSVPVTDEMLSYILPHVPEVEEVNLTLSDVTDKGVALLPQLPKLNYLRLKDTDITAKCIPAIAQITLLESVHLGDFDATCKDLLPLGNLEHLEMIIVHMEDVDTDALDELMVKKPNLELIVNSQDYRYR